APAPVSPASLHDAFRSAGGLRFGRLSKGPAPKRRSGRKPLAAATTARGDDAAAGLRGHARAEAMATLTDELRRLIGALHLFEYRSEEHTSELQSRENLV